MIHIKYKKIICYIIFYLLLFSLFTCIFYLYEQYTTKKKLERVSMYLLKTRFTIDEVQDLMLHTADNAYEAYKQDISKEEYKLSILRNFNKNLRKENEKNKSAIRENN